MRKLLTGVVVLLLAAVCQATPILKGPGDAWPWGAEMPFPWKGIQGTWVTTIGDQTIYFRFVTVRSAAGFNQLKVTEYSGPTCQVIAHGAGYEQSDRVVKAVMVGANGSFNMTVHVFREEDIKESQVPGYVQIRGAKTVTVMNMSPMGGEGSTRASYQLYKVDSDPAGTCEAPVKSCDFEFFQ